MRAISVLTIFVTACTVLACGKVSAGQGAVRFLLSAGNTRAAFSGAVGADGVERIDWEKDDRIRISSPQAFRADDRELHWADYRVEKVRTEGSSSFATVAPDGYSGLSWGEGTHSFHAAYPSPDSNDNGLEDSCFQGYIPAVQHLSWNDLEGLPDRGLTYLLAAADSVQAGETVSLRFRPAFTALTFSLSLDDTNPVPLSAFRLESSGGLLAGSFRTGWTGDAFPETGDDAADAIGISLDRTLEKGTPLTFTVICLPLPLTGLKAVFETAYGTKTLTLSRQDGTPVTFPACHRARITGLVLPGAPDISWTVDLIPWEEAGEERETADIE